MITDRYNPTAEWDYDEDEIDEEFPELSIEKAWWDYTVTKDFDEQWNEYIVEIFRDSLVHYFKDILVNLKKNDGFLPF